MTIPQHYMACKGSIEPKELLQYFPFFLGNAVKYILRYPYKGQQYSDLTKALDYLEWAKERKESPEYAAFYLAPLFHNDLLAMLIPKNPIESIQYDAVIYRINDMIDDIVLEEEARKAEETF